MSKNLKIFLLTFLASIPFWVGINVFQHNLEIFFYAKEIVSQPPFVFTANIFQESKKKSQLNICHNLDITAESAVSVEINGVDGEMILFQKNENQKMPIASITKIMTAIIALEIYPKNQKIEISKTAVGQPEDIGQLKPGEILRTEDLIAIMLVESSNDAATALTEFIGEEPFVHLMNLKAREINMEESLFFNPTGLDPDDLKRPAFQVNYSTPNDLVKLVKYALEKYPLVFDFLSRREYVLELEDGSLHHILRNTNQLLWKVSGIIGGKTGLTERAGECLVVILKGNRSNNYLVNVILNSQNRFEDMQRLIECSH